jgi:microcin C transport system permease protein
MLAYILKRLLLFIPTLFGILIINFFIIQSAPGGPVEQMLAKLKGGDVSSNIMLNGSSSGDSFSSSGDDYHEFIDPDVIQKIKKMYGFDEPIHIRFVTMIKNYLTFDFGDSFTQNKRVISLISEKLTVSLSLGLWSTLFIYLISIPLGIKKAVHHNTLFDTLSSSIIIIAYAIPGFLFAILLIIFFAGGNYLDWFPLRGLSSDNFDDLSTIGKIKDYFWHLTLPLLAFTISGFATLTILTKNSFLDEMNKPYVTTARSKGLTERHVLYKHVFRNAMLIIISGFPAAFISMFFTGSLLIEIIFSLDGLGLLGYESVINRDYPVIFATLYIFGAIGLITKLVSDICYILIDPRIDFQEQQS